MRISRFTILIFGIGMGVLASVSFQFGVSLQYVYLLMGVLIGSAVAPISFGILWKKTNKTIATSAAISGLILGVSSWLLTTHSMFGEITISSTGNFMPLLIGNVISIVSSLAITLIGSLLKSENFDFITTKQKIFLVDDRIRTMLRRDTNENILKNASKFCIKIGLLVSTILVIIWPLSLYIIDYVFSETAFYLWISVATAWAFGSAALIIILPLVEARRSISEIFHKANISSSRSLVTKESTYQTKPKDQELLKILVPVDDSVKSLKALNYVNYILKEHAKTRLYILNVIEWTDDEEENMDEELTIQIQEEGKKVLRSIIIPKKIKDYERLVKLGDPTATIVEIAEKLNADMIVMGKRGLGNSDSNIGHVTDRVLQLLQDP